MKKHITLECRSCSKQESYPVPPHGSEEGTIQSAQDEGWKIAPNGSLDRCPSCRRPEKDQEKRSFIAGMPRNEGVRPGEHGTDMIGRFQDD